MMRVCPECGSKALEKNSTEVVCKSCGLVVSDCSYE
ncbi:MAG: TFIIB-type zinc ribbon-containing protein [Candidatus Aenigmatarchaeota archaeon]